jgi:hypothetical protein
MNLVDTLAQHMHRRRRLAVYLDELEYPQVQMGQIGSQIDERFADVYKFDDGRIKVRKPDFFRPAA